jgi:hypothetical protein
MLISNSFVPPLLLRPAHIQTLLASSTIRAWGNNAMSEAAQEMILETPDGVRLLGFYSVQTLRPAKGLVILLHGWEGSVASTYILRTGKKQQLFPGLYDFDSVFSHKTLQEVTDVLLSKYSDYGLSRDYFKVYSVLNNAWDLGSSHFGFRILDFGFKRHRPAASEQKSTTSNQKPVISSQRREARDQKPGTRGQILDLTCFLNRQFILCAHQIRFGTQNFRGPC